VAQGERDVYKWTRLIPKGQSSFFLKNTSNLPFLAEEAQTNKIKQKLQF
jgi:hypothetical protein